MSEGDTVLVTAARLHTALAGHELIRTDLRVPRFATVDLSGQVVREAAARGKHLLVRTDAGLTIHSHLRMEGSWRVYRHGEPWRGPRHEVRAVLTTDDRLAIGHRLGLLEVFRTAVEPMRFAHLGPDVLGSDWDPDEALRRLRTMPDAEIGVALVDQRVMAGPGNVYKSEVCFLARIHPRARTSDLAEPEMLIELMKREMERNRTMGRQVTTGDPRPGHDRWVYGRLRKPCRRCGTSIRSLTQGAPGKDRSTYFCPRCQPVDAPSGSR